MSWRVSLCGEAQSHLKGRARAPSWLPDNGHAIRLPWHSPEKPPPLPQSMLPATGPPLPPSCVFATLRHPALQVTSDGKHTLQASQATHCSCGLEVVCLAHALIPAKEVAAQTEPQLSVWGPVQVPEAKRSLRTLEDVSWLGNFRKPPKTPSGVAVAAPQTSLTLDSGVRFPSWQLPSLRLPGLHSRVAGWSHHFWRLAGEG